MTEIETIRKRYQDQIARDSQSIQARAARWMTMGYLRGMSFLVALGLLIAAVTQPGGSLNLWWWLFAISLLGFLAVAAFHENLSWSIRQLRVRLRMDEASLARVERRLRDIEEPTPGPFPGAVDVCRDLDLFGDHSLFKLIGTVRTPVGVELLADWMIHGAEVSEIEARQASVRALKNTAEWRQRFQFLCEQLASSPTGPRDFVSWCQSPNWFTNRAWVLWLSRAAVGLLVIAFLIPAFGLLPLSTVAPAMAVAVLINFFLSVFFAGPVHDVFNQISSRYDETSRYVELFRLVRKCETNDGRLAALQQAMFHDDDILGGMIRLERLVWFANLRRHGLLFVFYLILQLTGFWDVHVLERLEAWRKRYGARAQTWFLALGEWEVLNALAKFAADHPDWTFPKVHEQSSDSIQISARGLGHPLLPQTTRVDNDVTLGPSGTFLLVTGSNMSGKSTLLRSLGLNITLAQMGSVVCARQFSLPLLAIDTSMRISDSLADGVSFFMAELKRLKAIVDRARSHASHPTRGHLFLLDEILQGTNSRERQIAVAEVVRQLVDLGSIGAISTHDLELAGVDSLSQKCHTVHFSEAFEMRDGQEVMTFDYQMKQGVAPTTNALKLLELVGLRERPRAPGAHGPDGK